MFDTVEITKDRINTFETDAARTDCEVGNELGIRVIMVMSGLVGVWGATCLISGLMSSTGIQELGRGLVTAITGM